MKYFEDLMDKKMEEAMNTNVRAYQKSKYCKSFRYHFDNITFKIIKFLAEL